MRLAYAALAALAIAAGVMRPADAQDTPPPRVVEWINRQVAAPETLDILKAPDLGSETIGRLRQGGSVRVLGLVDGGFLQIRLPDGQTLGYVPRTTLAMALDGAAPSLARPPPAPAQPPVAPAPPAPPLPVVVEGPATVLDSGAVLVGGRLRTLDGLQGFMGTHAQALQQYIAGNGGFLRCEQANGRYRCKLPNGKDIGALAVANGSAATVPGAPESYVQSEAEARMQRRGIWQQAVNLAQPLPGDNVAVVRPSAQAPLPYSEYAQSGSWDTFVTVPGPDGTRLCGMETAWRNGTAKLAFHYFRTGTQVSFVVVLRDDGWDVPPRLGGGGRLVTDTQSWPIDFPSVGDSGRNLLVGITSESSDDRSVMTRLATGTTVWVTSPMGRTPALNLVGSGAAVAALMRCAARIAPP